MIIDVHPDKRMGKLIIKSFCITWWGWKKDSESHFTSLYTAQPFTSILVVHTSSHITHIWLNVDTVKVCVILLTNKQEWKPNLLGEGSNQHVDSKYSLEIRSHKEIRKCSETEMFLLKGSIYLFETIWISHLLQSQM